MPLSMELNNMVSQKIKLIVSPRKILSNRKRSVNFQHLKIDGRIRRTSDILEIYRIM